jgi:excisionase family DNA binding protein
VTEAAATAEEKYLDLDAGAALLSISVRTLYRLREEKLITFYRISGLRREVRVKQSELLALPQAIVHPEAAHS